MLQTTLAATFIGCVLSCARTISPDDLPSVTTTTTTAAPAVTTAATTAAPDCLTTCTNPYSCTGAGTLNCETPAALGNPSVTKAGATCSFTVTCPALVPGPPISGAQTWFKISGVWADSLKPDSSTTTLQCMANNMWMDGAMSVENIACAY